MPQLTDHDRGLLLFASRNLSIPVYPNDAAHARRLCRLGLLHAEGRNRVFYFYSIAEGSLAALQTEQPS